MYRILLYNHDRRTIDAHLVLLADKKATLIRTTAGSIKGVRFDNAQDALECWRSGGSLCDVLSTLLTIEYAYRWARIGIEDSTTPQGVKE